MSLEVRVTGGQSFKELATRMRAEGRKDLAREMGRALEKAIEPVQVEIKTEAEQAAPSSGGYRSVLSKSLKFKTSKRSAGRSASLTLITYAEGKVERRDIQAFDKGLLRHPLWGNRNRWFTTPVRAGFHQRGTDSAMPAAAEQLDEVMADFAQRLID